MVDSGVKVEAAVRVLEKAEVVGVDVENHQRQSYEGFVCLV